MGQSDDKVAAVATLTREICLVSVRRRYVSHRATSDTAIAIATESATIGQFQWHIAGSRMAAMPT